MTFQKPIKTEKQHQQVLKRLEQIFDAKENTKEGDELMVLVMLIEEYERKHIPIKNADPIEAIKFRMDQQGLSISDLGKVLGYKSRASEILHRKRKLTLPMIRNLSEQLNIPASILIQSY